MNICVPNKQLTGFSKRSKRFDRFSIEINSGIHLPDSVGLLRYQQYIKEQGKPYPDANHDEKTLYDDLDPLSVHVVVNNLAGNLLSSLRFTPCILHTPEAHRDFVERQKIPIEQIVFLSRLVRSPSLEGAKTIKPIFKYSYEYCIENRTHIGLISTSPQLRPLFLRYGWRDCGSLYQDRYAGPQHPLYLDALDLKYLKKVHSPYLEDDETQQ